VGSGAVFVKNKGDGLDFASIAKVTVGPDCDFGWLSMLLNFGSQMSIYTHWLSAAPANSNTPQIMLRGGGNVMLDILGYLFDFGAFRFVQNFDNGTMKVDGMLNLQFTKVPVFRLGGLLGPDGGTLSSAFDFTIDLLWGAILSWKGSIKVSALRNSDPSFEMEGSFELGSFKIHAVSSVRMLDDRVVFALCNSDLPRFGNDILAIIRNSPGPDNCMDLRLLFNGVPTGGTCVTNKMCTTGRCDVKSNQIYGTCIARLADGARCNENSDCISNRCEFGQFSFSGPGTCQPMVATGGACGDDDDCISERCERKRLGALSGKCQDRVGDGTRCDEHSDCLSNYCSVGLNRKCAPLRSTGQQGWVNRACQSGSCSFCGFCPEIKKCD